MTDAVTFVVANYNYGRYLTQAVDSLLDQSYQPLDVVVVDDCSSDLDTPRVLASLEANPRVRVIRHTQRLGNRVADNEGIEMARGGLVGTLDADDFCLARDAVQRQVDVFAEDPSIAFVYTAYLLCHADGTPLREYRPFENDRIRDGLAEFADLAFANHVSHSGTMVRRSYHEAVGGYDPRLPYAGDLDLWLRLAGRYRVGYLAEPMYAYRQHAQSMTYRGISPGTAIDEMLAAVNRGFACLPPETPRQIRDLQPHAIQRVLLSMTWRERSLGHTRRSWHALWAALTRSPALMRAPVFHASLGRLLLLTALGHARYERLSGWRARRGARRRGR